MPKKVTRPEFPSGNLLREADGRFSKGADTKGIQRTPHAPPAAIEHVGVNHVVLTSF